MRKFPSLLDLVDNGEDSHPPSQTKTTIEVKIEVQFSMYQVERLPEEILIETRADTQWKLIGKILDGTGKEKFGCLSKLMLSIFSIGHSNADCERVFSLVNKCHTDQRPTMGPGTLEALVVQKVMMKGPCYKQKLTQSQLTSAEKATAAALAAAR